MSENWSQCHQWQQHGLLLTGVSRFLNWGACLNEDCVAKSCHLKSSAKHRIRKSANSHGTKQGKNPSRASRVFQRETSLKPAFRTCFENAPSKRGLRRNFFFNSFHWAYMDFKALHRCETHCIFSWDRHCQLRMYSINLGLICLLHFPVLCKVSGIHFLILFQVASAFCVPAILLALQGFRFKRRMTC